MRNNEDNQTTFGIILVIGFTIMGPVMDTFAKLAANWVVTKDVAIPVFVMLPLESILIFWMTVSFLEVWSIIISDFL